MLIHTIMLGAGLLGAFASGPVGDSSQRSAQAGNPEVVVAVHYSARTPTSAAGSSGEAEKTTYRGQQQARLRADESRQ